MLNPYGVQAAREYLLAGNAITRLEAMVLFAVPDLTKIISDLRSEGHKVERQTVPLAGAIRRVNQAATLIAPPALPVSDIKLTEYWIAS
ncbi:helix-turn-helix domain-containing protein [Sphingomonas sp. GCM10030256]|uniref:helix-turn-helix domain-containing protein n=1 Tax=Sphingomonas sp. GCM10030256 TaxID=3273427 RepID=UPI00361742C0